MRAVYVLASLFVLLVPAFPSAVAESTGTVETLSVRLPYGWVHGASVWTGNVVYLLGGTWGTLEDEVPILRFDPTTNAIRRESVRLPCTRISAVWTGTEVLAFGGYCSDLHEQSARVWRFDPQSQTLEVVGEMPSPREKTSAVFDKRYAYVVSGETSGFFEYNDTNREIVRVDPRSGESSVVSRSLPDVTRGVVPATWDGTRIVVFTAYGPHLFDPSTGEVTDAGLHATFPSATDGPAVQAGAHAYLFGGRDAYDRRSVARIVRYDSAANTWAELPLPLPRPLASMPAVWTGDRALVFGGYGGNGATDTILVFRPVDFAVLTTVFILIPTVAAVVAVVIFLRRRRKRNAPE